MAELAKTGIIFLFEDIVRLFALLAIGNRKSDLCLFLAYSSQTFYYIESMITMTLIFWLVQLQPVF